MEGKYEAASAGKGRQRALVGALALLLLANGGLVLQNRSLKQGSGLVLGEAVANPVRDIVGVDAVGTRRRVDLASSRERLILTFSATCPYCEEILPVWRRLAEDAEDAGWEVVWVSRDPLEVGRRAAFAQGQPGLVLTDVPYQTYAQLGMASVPRTVLLGAGGEVLQAVLGVIDDSKVAELRRMLRSRAAKVNNQQR